MIIDNPSALVPKPGSATQQSDVTANINVKLNMRFGPDILYDRVSGANMPAEIMTGDKVTFFEPGVDDGKGRLWVYAIRHRAGTDLHGWLSKTDFSYHPVTKPLPPVASVTPANVTPLDIEPPVIIPPAVPQFDPPAAPVSPLPSDSAQVAMMTPETPENGTYAINIAIKSDEGGMVKVSIVSDTQEAHETIISMIDAIRIVGNAFTNWADTMKHIQVQIV